MKDRKVAKTLNRIEQPETPVNQSCEKWADWLVDAVATATQDRRFLRGDPAEDTVATEAIRRNGMHAIKAAINNAGGVLCFLPECAEHGCMKADR